MITLIREAVRCQGGLVLIFRIVTRSGRVFTTPRSRNILATVILLLIIINNNIRCCIIYNTAAYLIIMSIIHRQLGRCCFPTSRHGLLQDSESCHSTKWSRSALPTYLIIIRVDRTVIVFYVSNFFFLSRRYFSTWRRHGRITWHPMIVPRQFLFPNLTVYIPITAAGCEVLNPNFLFFQGWPNILKDRPRQRLFERQPRYHDN